jgi:multicomponent Na+:H+ antiporter subunit C
MTNVQLYALCGAALFGLGFGGVVLARHLVRKVIALNLQSAGTFLVLIALARRTGHGAPDPVPQAMVLTGIVVSISSTALALALVRRLHRETGHTELPI